MDNRRSFLTRSLAAAALTAGALAPGAMLPGLAGRAGAAPGPVPGSAPGSDGLARLKVRALGNGMFLVGGWVLMARDLEAVPDDGRALAGRLHAS